jgi:hypothetical protein
MAPIVLYTRTRSHVPGLPLSPEGAWFGAIRGDRSEERGSMIPPEYERMVFMKVQTRKWERMSRPFLAGIAVVLTLQQVPHWLLHKWAWDSVLLLARR